MKINKLDKIELNFKIKSFKLRDEFKISRISKKSIQVIDISLTKNRITVLSECIPYARYNENMEDVLGYLNRNKSKIEDILKEEESKLKTSDKLPLIIER